MLQEILPYKLDNHYYPDSSPSEDSFVMCFRRCEGEVEILINKDFEGECFPVYGNFNAESVTYLFKIDKRQYYLLSDDIGKVSFPSETMFKNVREIRREGKLPDHQVFALYTAFHLYEWYESAVFCGRCGEKTVHDDKERAMVCPKCGNRIYPRINPAVIIGVTDKETNKLILTKYRTGFAQNALVAGFTEIGETLEETVKREVMEEVGLEVDNIRYYKSQPWGVALDILGGFYCDVVGSKEIKMDASELKYAEWVAPEDIVLQSPDYSLTNEMMRVFKEKGYSGTL
jgi:NAD+ diphosphatase